MPLVSNRIMFYPEKEKELIVDEGGNFEAVMLKAQEIANGCWDDVCLGKDIRTTTFTEGGISFRFNNTARKLTRFSLSQLCNRIEVPGQFVQKTIKNHIENPDAGFDILTDDILNRYIQMQPDKKYLVRVYKNTVRGILSDKYSKLDTVDILNNVKDICGDMNLAGYMINPERLHLRLMFPDLINIGGDDSPYAYGVTIDSSDVGRSCLNVNFLLFRQVCKNGLMLTSGGGKVFKQKHMGIDVDDFYFGIRNALVNIKPLVTEVVGKIEAAMADKGFIKVTDVSEKEIDGFIGDLVKELGISERRAEKVIDLVRNTYDESRWGFASALVEMAKEYDLEKRVEIEAYAGEVMIAA